MRPVLAAAASVALLASLTGCNLVGQVVTTGPVTQSVAETSARMASGVSLASVEVQSSRLSTYGAERPGGTLRPADAQVWAVILSGAFPHGSCKITIPVFGSSFAPQQPCPTPARRELILIDAKTGQLIETIQGV